MNPLLTQGMLEGIRGVAQSALQQAVVIERRTGGDAGTVSTGGDYGDDDVTYVETTESRRTTVYGMFDSTPTPVQVEDAGGLVTVNTYLLSLPVGTDIREGDTVVVGDAQYAVSDTTVETTWQALLAVSLRKMD